MQRTEKDKLADEQVSRQTGRPGLKGCSPEQPKNEMAHREVSPKRNGDAKSGEGGKDARETGRQKVVGDHLKNKLSKEGD